ncbi:hypothetical protein Tco_0789068 [Tanacetum coccineum]
MSENEDRYHDIVLDLEAKLKKNGDLILKLSNSLQGMFMLRPNPLSVYDQQLKHGLGYPNPYTLKQAISQCPKLYLASSLGNLDISLNVRNTEDTLDDASKSQQKVYEKINDPIAVANKHNCWTIDYAQINALYKEFVPQKELSAEQKYFSSSFIPSDKNSNATPFIPTSMPRMNTASSVRRPMNKDLHVKNSVLANSKKPTKKVAVYVRKNNQTDITSENVISNKENVIDVDVANASKAKTLLCVSCMQNVLIPCHNNCFANYKLNVRSNVHKLLSTKSRTPKSYDTTYVVRKTRFSNESTLSKSLDTTYVVSKHKIDVRSTSKANDKVVPDCLWIVDRRCCTCNMKGLGHNSSLGWDNFVIGDLEVAFHSKTRYVRNLEGDDLLTGDRESNLYTISISDMAASSPVCLRLDLVMVFKVLNVKKILCSACGKRK